jgi:hypothetical protein
MQKSVNAVAHTSCVLCTYPHALVRASASFKREVYALYHDSVGRPSSWTRIQQPHAYMSTIVLSSCGHTVRLFGLEVMSEPSGQDATLAAENETRYWSPNHALSYCLEGLTPMSMSRLPGKTSFCSDRKAFMIESHIVATIIIEMHLP